MSLPTRNEDKCQKRSTSKKTVNKRTRAESMDEYTLLITEKPQAARLIAHALDKNGRPKEYVEKGIHYYEAVRDEKLVIVSALGHLYTIVGKQRGRDHYPIFDFEWVARNVVERNSKRIKACIDVISRLAKGATSYVSACDYDLEGSLIGYCVLKYACENKETEAGRMKFSTLTKKELVESYEKILPKLDFGKIEAGKTRHEVDWIYGINLSRALTQAAAQWSGEYSTISVGRVQGPTMNFFVERERKIRSFLPLPYWKLKAEAEIRNSIYEIDYEVRRIQIRKKALEILRNCEGKKGIVAEIYSKMYLQSPPIPFNTSSLQTEAYRIFGYNPKTTLRVAERLYLSALISYPRTDSQKLPPFINYRETLRRLSNNRRYKEKILNLLKKKKLLPKQGKRNDPAHPAIYPTGNFPSRLRGTDRKIYDLITHRFIAAFGENAYKESTKATIRIGKYNFLLRGKRIIDEGWMHYYSKYFKENEKVLPQLDQGEIVFVKKLTLEDRFSTPPFQYNPSSIIKKMETSGIGTKTTRANVLQTLYNRDYIREKRISVTHLGFDVVDVLNDFCPDVLSIEMTKDLENRMSAIQEGKLSREAALQESIKLLKPALHDLKKMENNIGKKLSQAIRKVETQRKILGFCPDCKTGELLIIRSKKTKKRFIGCSNYFKNKCNTSYPLPQSGTITATNRLCKACRIPLIKIRLKNRRPWRSCVNPKCPSKLGKTDYISIK